MCIRDSFRRGDYVQGGFCPFPKFQFSHWLYWSALQQCCRYCADYDNNWKTTLRTAVSAWNVDTVSSILVDRQWKMEEEFCRAQSVSMTLGIGKHDRVCLLCCRCHLKSDHHKQFSLHWLSLYVAGDTQLTWLSYVVMAQFLFPSSSSSSSSSPCASLLSDCQYAAGQCSPVVTVSAVQFPTPVSLNSLPPTAPLCTNVDNPHRQWQRTPVVSALTAGGNGRQSCTSGTTDVSCSLVNHPSIVVHNVNNFQQPTSVTTIQ